MGVRVGVACQRPVVFRLGLSIFARLAGALRDLGDDLFFVGELAGFQLGVNLFAIDRDLEPAAVRRHEFQVRELSLTSPEHFLRQTDGLRLVISRRTIDDSHSHF